jgi:hypothetical protein
LPTLPHTQLSSHPPANPWEMPQNPISGTTNDRRLQHNQRAATTSAFTTRHSSMRVNAPRGPGHHRYPTGTTATSLAWTFRGASAYNTAATGPVTRSFQILILPYGVCNSTLSFLMQSYLILLSQKDLHLSGKTTLILPRMIFAFLHRNCLILSISLNRIIFPSPFL